MRKWLVLILFFAGVSVANARYVMIADTLQSSAYYPGTKHCMQVSVPEVCDSSRTVGLYLGLDGILCSAPDVLDTLASQGVIPPMAGVYLQPGVIEREGTTLRFNRSNEFDAIDSRFADFLALEVLPRVDSILRSDGRGLTITDNSADRMIFGLSSGGIAAFVAAWHRPNLFGKVFTGCGTFVPMRGGHNLQAIVRKHEPKPLRIFMQDGSKDAWNPLFGSWYEANRVLATALQFAGYDCGFKWDDSGHSVRPSAEIFPDVIRWLWRDGSLLLRPGTTSNNYLCDKLPPSDVEGYAWREVDTLQQTPTGNCEVYYPDSSLMAVVEPGTNFLMQYIVDSDGNRTCGQRYYWLHTYDNSQLHIADINFDGDGNLWTLTNAGIQICDQNGRVRGILSLPDGINIGATTTGRLILNDGVVVVTVAEKDRQARTFSRKFGVRKAVPGVRPKSQGAA